MKLNEAIEKKFRNVEAEYQVAAYVALYNASLSAAINTVWFTVQSLVYIMDFVKKYKVTITEQIVFHELKKKHFDMEEDVFHEAFEKMQAANVKHLSVKSINFLVKQLSDLYDSRTMLKGIASVVLSVKQQKFSLSKSKRLLRSLSKEQSVDLSDNQGDYLEDFDKRVELVEQRVKSDGELDDFITTGITLFDKAIGGLMPTEFAVVAGKTGVGKTAMLIHLAINAWLQGKCVFFATGEMSKELIEFRIDSNLAAIPSQKFRIGDLSKSEWKRWRDKIKELRLTQQSFFEIVSFPRNFSADDIRAEISRIEAKRENKVDMLCIDYLNIMNASSLQGSSKDWTSQADAVWDIKGIAADLNIVVWTAGQIRDEAYDVDRLELEHLKYARAIGETAPIVVGLVQTVDDELENRLQFQILKMRNAKRLADSIYLHPRLDLMRIHERFLKSKDIRDFDDTQTIRKRKRKR